MTTIESEQSREIRLTEIGRGPFLLRFLSYRKSEDAALNLRSEDYIVSELTPEKAIFGLCDGVGSSFYGNIGSQILGEILLSWLGKVTLPNSLSLEKPQVVNSWLSTLTADLTTELNNRISFATSVIQKKEIASPDELVRLAEETQRDDFGTQSNFAAGIVWPKSPSLPNGLVLLFWLGNARLRIFNHGRDLTATLGWGKDPDQLTQVWSSKDGVLGKVYSHVTDLAGVTHVIAYSDGLENAEQDIHPNLDAARLETLVQQSQSIKDDDATFLELTTRTDEIPGLADDIVTPLRKQIHPAETMAAQPEPEAQKLKAALAALQKKYDAQNAGRNRNRGMLIAGVALLAALCFCSGLFLRPFLRIGPTPTPTQPASVTPTIFLSDTPTLTFTSSPSATATETATPSATETPPASPTPSPTPTASNTPGT